MFSVEERDRIRACLLAFAEADTAVVGAAFTGSHAVGDADRWSDIDLVLGVRHGLAPTLSRWTAYLYDEFGALHHWDLPADGRIVRVFLLPRWLELDITFAEEAAFGARGPQWRTLFGRPRSLEPFGSPDVGTLIGLAWHHALHARVCIERGRGWQAAHWIGALRDHVISLACLRLGHPAHYAKGAHLLPGAVTAPLEATLVRTVTGPELRRALAAAVSALTDELGRSDPALAGRLQGMLTELTDADSSGPGEPGQKRPG